jgi:hypothetical protein
MRGVRQSRQSQDYSGFGLKPQTPTPKSAQLSRACASQTEVMQTKHANVDEAWAEIGDDDSKVLSLGLGL